MLANFSAAAELLVIMYKPSTWLWKLTYFQ